MRVVLLALLSVASALPLDMANGTSENGYVRMSLDLAKCPNMCSGRGHCVQNTDSHAPPANTTICVCEQGWGGDDCSAVLLPAGARDEGELDCPNHCSSHGVCHRGSSVIRPRCYCDSHYTGIDCSRVKDQAIFCPNNCSGFGVCTDGWSDRYGSVVAQCMCDENHKGEDCAIEVYSLCKGGCSGNGECTSDGCLCHAGFIGSDCSLRDIPQCLNNCSSRGRCLQGKCYCNPGYGNADCSLLSKPPCKNACSGHGRCVADTQYFPGGCACDKGWFGSDCSIPKLVSNLCPLECSHHGFCYNNGTCLCEAGYAGEACQFVTTAAAITVDGTGPLHPYYMDEKYREQSESDRTRIVSSNEHPTCPNNCSSNGVCEEVVTDTLNLYRPDGTKINTGNVKLPAPTKQFQCRCDPGFTGADCAIKPKSNVGAASPPPEVVKSSSQESAPSGLFAEDTTQWDALPSSTQLKIKQMPCPSNCSSRGRCLRDERGYPYCSCYPGWTAFDCSAHIPDEFHCPLQCSDHGKCVTASEYFPVHCMCDEGWHGENCEKPNPIKVTYELEDVHEGFCANHCSHRGTCVNGKCVCMELGWGGADCSLRAGGSCPSNCNGNGMCFWGICECLGGYSGLLCDVEPHQPCPNNCQMHGKCVGGQCMCLTGFTGDDCSDIIVECPRHCSGHGECIPAEPERMRPARCECAEGFTGADCSNFPLNAESPPVEFPTPAQKALEEQKERQEAKGHVFENPK